jgi:hypothetical protein
MSPFLVEEIFPAGILPVIKQYLKNPKASTSADHALSAALRIYDPPDQTLRLEELPFDSSFSLSGKGIFLKKEKLRTRYRCICLKTNRIYLVNPNAPVLPIINSFK